MIVDTSGMLPLQCGHRVSLGRWANNHSAVPRMILSPTRHFRPTGMSIDIGAGGDFHVRESVAVGGSSRRRTVKRLTSKNVTAPHEI